jgi:hypothetical protein
MTAQVEIVLPEILWLTATCSRIVLLVIELYLHNYSINVSLWLGWDCMIARMVFR